MILKKWDELPEDIKNEKMRIYYNMLEKRKMSLLIKRLFDILFSLILLIILSPIFIILAIWIKIDSEGSVFYRQERITTNGKIFKIFKFRTMIQDADKKGSVITLDEDSRITRVGKIIRKLRLDEIPQLINVLIGDMTFVGTRPEVKKYVDKYSDEMKATLLMPAGITSMASIKYKDEDKILEKHIVKTREEKHILVGKTSELTHNNLQEKDEKSIDDVYIEKVLPEKMKYNLEYIQKFNMIEDLKIMLNTIIAVLRKDRKQVIQQNEKEIIFK